MAPAVADLKAMTDAFEGIDKLAEGAPRTDGAPNFRRVNSDKNTNTNTKRGRSQDSRVTTLINLRLTWISSKTINCDILVSGVQVLE